MANVLRYETIKPALKLKDGLIHTITITNKEDTEPSASIVRPYSNSINHIVEGMQRDGYEILNIDQSIATYGDGDARDYMHKVLFSTLIVYK